MLDFATRCIDQLVWRVFTLVIPHFVLSRILHFNGPMLFLILHIVGCL
uniref:Transcription elongation factor SPT6-like isoform X2 n=1 Tax=Rhizophora mucronata TaxID=61149 RepID=A0A2P2KHV3_RHIMU